MRYSSFFLAIALCVTPMLAEAAGFQLIDVPAGADGPAFHAAIWYPCSEPGGEISLGDITLPGVKDCPISGDRLPLVVISHGRGGSFIGHHDTAETLADAGFVVAALNHPGDNASDLSHTQDRAVFIERPRDVKRLIDFMLRASPAATKIDGDRIGFFGFSRGGYTGLIVIGATPDWAASELCKRAAPGSCEEMRKKAGEEIGKNPGLTALNDPRVKAAVIADPLAVVFGPASFAAVKVPVQLWASERGGDGVSPESVAAVDTNLSAAHEFHTVPNAGHFAFLVPCPPQLAAQRPEVCADAPGFDRVAFHKELNAAVLVFFRKYLKPPA